MGLCMRQSIQERRIAVQLMQLRHEKDVIRRNRLAKEKQFEEARVKEFEEALNREKVGMDRVILGHNTSKLQISSNHLVECLSNFFSDEVIHAYMNDRVMSFCCSVFACCYHRMHHIDATYCVRCHTFSGLCLCVCIC